MSFSSHRKAALDGARPLEHRASHARSCAVVVSEKLRVDREEVIKAVQRLSGVSLHAPKSSAELQAAIEALEALRSRGL